jgi:hypothetical protein
MTALVTSLATDPPADMPIWARLLLADRGVAITEVRYWQRMNDTTIYVFTDTSLVPLVKG